jgi:hypothetical protein
LHYLRRENSPQITQIKADTTRVSLFSVPATRGKAVIGTLSASICVICGKKMKKSNFEPILEPKNPSPYIKYWPPPKAGEGDLG